MNNELLQKIAVAWPDMAHIVQNTQSLTGQARRLLERQIAANVLNRAAYNLTCADIYQVSLAYRRR